MKPGPHFAFRTDRINVSGSVSFHIGSDQTKRCESDKKELMDKNV